MISIVEFVNATNIFRILKYFSGPKGLSGNGKKIARNQDNRELRAIFFDFVVNLSKRVIYVFFYYFRAPGF